MDWLMTSLQWYLYLFVLGLIFFPITRRLFPSFYDHGYAFSKTIAILVLSYLTFVLGVAKLLPFTQINLILIIVVLIIISILQLRTSKSSFKLPTSSVKILLFEELLFLASFIFLAYVRGQEPSIRGLEKFMDFGFINSLLRSRFFPPADIWYAGKAINYYYFGHLTGAFLIKLTGIKPSIGYNLLLATIFAQTMTLTFSLVSNIINAVKKIEFKRLVFFGLMGAFITNLAGNLHTIYLFTKGYPNDSPIPFWRILSTFNPAKYWYPNATRFIPFTIHEFPSYSWVVADLHGHVFDIPFVLLTLAILFLLVSSFKLQTPDSRFQILVSIALGFMTAVHYMTNAFDGPIYFLLSIIIFFFLFGPTLKFLLASSIQFLASILFSLPFSLNFSPFVSGIGLNCSPDFLIRMKKLGPFLFESNNCQASPPWMLLILWGFFLINFVIFTLIYNKKYQFILILFAFGIFLIIIPEFFYIKDIYPAHFRANTMFKLGYQAFIMMSIASTVVLFLIKNLKHWSKYIFKTIFLITFFLIIVYPFFAFPSYYGNMKKKPQLDGSLWMAKTGFLQDLEIVDYLNKHVSGQPIILEAQGDSYTDYERISAYTGLPTVAGWWVHEWLWRGSPDAVGQRIPDVAAIYESPDLSETKELIRKYSIRYIVVSGLEREKYKKISEKKFEQIGRKVFESSNGFGALYQSN